MKKKDITIVKDGEMISLSVQRTAIERQYLQNLSLDDIYLIQKALNEFTEKLLAEEVDNGSS